MKSLAIASPVCWLLLATMSVSPLFAQAVDSPARLVSEASAVFLAIDRPEALIDAATNPKLHEKLNQIEAVEKYYISDDYLKFRAVVGLMEARLGVKWPEALRDLVGGVYLAHDPKADAPLLFVRARKPELLKRLHDAIVGMIETEAALRGQPSAAKSTDHAGVTGWTFGKDEYHAIIDGMLVVTNKSSALKAVAEQHQSGSGASLAGVAKFQQARSAAGSNPIAWGFVDLQRLRELPKVRAALSERTNPLVELLAGGVRDSLARASHLVASLHVEQREARLRFTLPSSAKSVVQSRSWFFAADGQPAADRPLNLPGTIAAASLYRNVSGMWLARDELFDEKTNAGFTQADTGLGLFFSGRDFGTEILGELGPRWQLIAARRQFNGPEPTPALRLPAFAAVLELKNGEFAKTLIQAYQNIIGLQNLQGAQNGRPQMFMASELYREVSISTATHAIVPKQDQEQGRIDYNFQPSCAQVGERFVIGSTVEIVRAIIDALKSDKSNPPSSTNARLDLDATQLRQALADNRELIVSRHIISSGKSNDAGRREIDQLFDLGALIEHAGIQLSAAGEALALELAVRFGSP